MNCTIHTATSRQDITRCYPVMHELRPHLGEASFVTQVQRQQQAHGYQLACAEVDGEVRAVAGYRITECLAWGRFLYVDDLVTRATDQAKGCGSALFDWLLEQARQHDCQEFHLDSGVQRFGAHRFYLHKRMDITSHHFALRLNAKAT